jgi:hypothetical protein
MKYITIKWRRNFKIRWSVCSLILQHPCLCCLKSQVVWRPSSFFRAEDLSCSLPLYLRMLLKISHKRVTQCHEVSSDSTTSKYFCWESVLMVVSLHVLVWTEGNRLLLSESLDGGGGPNSGPPRSVGQLVPCIDSFRVDLNRLDHWLSDRIDSRNWMTGVPTD